MIWVVNLTYLSLYAFQSVLRRAKHLHANVFFFSDAGFNCPAGLAYFTRADDADTFRFNDRFGLLEKLPTH